MAGWYNERRNKGYEIQYYDYKGNACNVHGCDSLEEVAKALISMCNGNVKGNFPTIWLDGKLVKDK